MTRGPGSTSRTSRPCCGQSSNPVPGVTATANRPVAADAPHCQAAPQRGSGDDRPVRRKPGQAVDGLREPASALFLESSRGVVIVTAPAPAIGHDGPEPCDHHGEHPAGQQPFAGRRQVHPFHRSIPPKCPGTGSPVSIPVPRRRRPGLRLQGYGVHGLRADHPHRDNTGKGQGNPWLAPGGSKVCWIRKARKPSPCLQKAAWLQALSADVAATGASGHSAQLRSLALPLVPASPDARFPL